MALMITGCVSGCPQGTGGIIRLLQGVSRVLGVSLDYFKMSAGYWGDP